MRTSNLILTTLLLCLAIASKSDDVKQSDIMARSIAYEPLSRRIYASVSSKAPSMQNSLVIIDPFNAKIEKSVDEAMRHAEVKLDGDDTDAADDSASDSE